MSKKIIVEEGNAIVLKEVPDIWDIWKKIKNKIKSKYPKKTDSQKKDADEKKDQKKTPLWFWAGLATLVLFAVFLTLIFNQKSLRREKLPDPTKVTSNKNGAGKKNSEPTPAKPMKWVLAFVDPLGEYDPWPMNAEMQVQQGAITIIYLQNRYADPKKHRVGKMIAHLDLRDGVYRGSWVDWRKGANKRNKQGGIFEMKQISPLRFSGWAKKTGKKMRKYPMMIYRVEE